MRGRNESGYYSTALSDRATLMFTRFYSCT
jgi:hypothetical protein